MSGSSTTTTSSSTDPKSEAKAKAMAAAAMHRKIRQTGSHLTASTASLTVSAADDDNDNDNDDNDCFTELICRHHRRRSVRFSSQPPKAVHCGPSNEGGDRRSDQFAPVSETTVERGATNCNGTNHRREGLSWYSKAEVQRQRHDVQKTIRSLRRHAHCPEGSAHVLLASASSSSSTSCRINPSPPLRSGTGDSEFGMSTSPGEDEEPPASVRSAPEKSGNNEDEKDDDLCYRGCERYYSLETRFMAQKMVVDAVLDAQTRHRKGITSRKDVVGEGDAKENDGGNTSNSSKEEALRRLSEEISKPGRELAQWHAALNAFQCYGFAGLALSTDASKVQVRGAVLGGDRPSPPPSKRSNLSSKDNQHARSTSLHADTLWWEQAVLTCDDQNLHPSAAPGATSPLTSDEESSVDNINIGSVRSYTRRPGDNNAAARINNHACAPTSSFASANVVTPPPPPRRHRRSTSMPSPPTEYIFAPKTAAAASTKRAAATATRTAAAAAAASAFAARPERFPHVVPRS
jgi:hypothetical protein